MRKRQLDKIDKSKEDYEFERQQNECTFAPKIYSKQPKYIRDKVQSKIMGNQPDTTISQEPQMTKKDRQALYEQK